MNRIRKYRAYDTKNKTWIQNIGMQSNNILTDGTEAYIHAMDFIGLTDKNGKEIFEGDVVRVLYTDWISKQSTDKRTLEQYLIDISSIGFVEFFRSQWCVNFGNSTKYGEISRGSIYCGKHGFIEVIGNIHDNPDLLQPVADNT